MIMALDPRRWHPAVIVFGVFLLFAAGLIALSLPEWHHRSTWTPLAHAFAWSLMTMIVSGTCAIITGRPARQYRRARSGKTRIAIGPQGQSQSGPGIEGPGGEMQAGSDTVIISIVPAMILLASTIGLLCYDYWLWRTYHATTYGALIALALPYFQLHWAWNALPASRRPATRVAGSRRKDARNPAPECDEP